MSGGASRPRPTLLYRITHVENLTLLARRGCLHAPAHAPADGLAYRGIHDQSIRARRGARGIPCGPGGTVDDYVSFYLCFKSPMLYRIEVDASLRPPEGLGAIVYLVSSVERVQELGLPWVFSDGHGLQAISRWYDDPDRLEVVDWEAIAAGFWRPPEDPDLARRKQAEVLIHRTVPLEALLGIACLDTTAKAAVTRRLAGGPARGLPVVARPDWYYRLES